MNHHDAELSDVIVVLEEMDDAQTQETVKLLKAQGMEVTSVDNDQSTVEGNIETAKVRDLHHVKGVRYVRPTMSYTVDYPPGDPRDKDGPEDAVEDGED